MKDEEMNKQASKKSDRILRCYTQRQEKDSNIKNSYINLGNWKLVRDANAM